MSLSFLQHAARDYVPPPVHANPARAAPGMLGNYCDGSFSADDAESLWVDSGAGVMVDSLVQNADSDSGKGWFEGLVEVVYGNGGALDCTTITGGGCDIDFDKCDEMSDKGQGSAFWALKSASSLNLMFSELHEKWIQNGAIESTLDIPSIKETFSPPDTDTSGMWLLMSGAFGMAAGAGSFTGGPWSSSYGIISSMMSVGGLASQPDDDDSHDLEDMVSAFFKATDSALSNAMHNALGYGDQNELPESLLSDEGGSTPTARFFGNGKFLRKNVGLDLKPFIAQAKNHLSQALAFHSMEDKVGYWIQVRDDLDDCSGGTLAHVDVDGGHCMEILKTEMEVREIWKRLAPGNGPNPGGAGPQQEVPIIKRPSDDMLDALKGWDVDYAKVYKNAWECSERGKDDRKPQYDDIVPGGDVPGCYFSMEVKKDALAYFEDGKMHNE